MSLGDNLVEKIIALLILGSWLMGIIITLSYMGEE